MQIKLLADTKPASDALQELCDLVLLGFDPVESIDDLFHIELKSIPASGADSQLVRFYPSEALLEALLAGRAFKRNLTAV
jgi:hypothetical protein